MIRSWQKITVSKLHVNGMALFPFVLIRKRELNENKIFINHERIHLRQQIEMLILPFYFFYLLNYCINRFKYKNHDQAYRNICFEREAYKNESNLSYLSLRKLYSWLKYL